MVWSSFRKHVSPSKVFWVSGYKSLKPHEKQTAAGQCFKTLEWMFNKYTVATA